MANGQSNTGKLSGRDAEKFQDAVNEVSLKLANDS
jgi:hypothetical protein